MNYFIHTRQNAGFTLLELMVVLAIVAVVGAISISNFGLLQKKYSVDGSMQEFVGIISLAKSNTVSSEAISQYGIYINTATFPNAYVLFKGSSYDARDVSYDKTYVLPSTLQFADVSLQGGNEIVFDRLTGASGQSGNVTLRSIADNAQSKTMYISSAGTIGFLPIVAPSDASRSKDSRHLHHDYSRSIDSAAETLTLTIYNADDTISQLVPITFNTYLTACKFLWTGTVDGQTIEIATHGLTTTDAACTTGTQFTIHRDRRYNTKKLKITMSGDDTGALAEYAADGLTVTHASSYVANVAWQ